jgi:hypothetical protein
MAENSLVHRPLAELAVVGRPCESGICSQKRRHRRKKAFDTNEESLS